MNCREFQELIAGSVDRCLSGAEQKEFDAHADACALCRRELELERSTKDLLRRRTQMVAVPERLQVSILDTLARERPPLLSSRLFRYPFVRPALAFAVTAAVIAIVVVRQSDEPRAGGAISAGFAPANVLLQSVTNYHRALSGEFAPRETSGETERLVAFFSGKTAFPVLVPQFQNCTLLGGELNDQAGTPVAHLMYRNGDTLIYLYQTCWTTVQRGEIFELSPETKTELLNTGWHCEQASDGDGIVMRAAGGTLCVAVAQMGPERLRTILQVASPQPGPETLP